MDEILRPILEAAERDPDVVGVYVKGSACHGHGRRVVGLGRRRGAARRRAVLSRSETLDLARRAVEQVATADGFRDMYDAWDGEIDRVMEIPFE